MQTVSKIMHDRVSSSSQKTMHVNCKNPISALALNRDANQVVVAGRNVFKIYGIEDDKFEEKHNLRVGKNINLNYCAMDIAWNQTEDHILATGATNGAVVVWDLNRISRSKQEHVFQEHRRTVNRVCFHDNESRMLLSASQDGSVKLFDIRKKELSLSFSIGETSVRDIQFSPFNYFSFASADEGGNLHIWDIRQPYRVEKQFTAHNGPIFSIDWHPEDKNLIATAGRDRLIQIWDLQKCQVMNTIYSIASVARVRWRPQRKYHIATCCLVVDCSINIWDVRRPFVPFAMFDNHKDVTTSIVFRNKDPHVIISGSKDSELYQHVFTDAKRPGEDLVPAGLDLNVYGNIGHAHSDRQGKLTATQSSSGLFSFNTKKYVERNDQFVDVCSHMQVYEECQQKLSLSWLVESACRYKLKGQSIEELCKHNAKVAESLNRIHVAQCWLILLSLYSSQPVEPHQARTTSVLSSAPPHQPRTTSVLSDRTDTETLKAANDSKPETDLEDKNVDMTSGNSDEETDEREQSDNKLTNIARGQLTEDCYIFFGDGDQATFDMNGLEHLNSNKHDWTLPTEAFQPRHEIHDRETPLESLTNSSHEAAMLGEESEVSSVVVTPTQVKEPNNVLTTDMEYLQKPDWDFSHTVVDMLKHLAEQGDVQTPVCMLIVLKDKIRHLVDSDLQEDWFLSYIELLGRFKLWTIANNIVKLSNLHSVSMLNQQSTAIHVNCNMCNRPLQRTGWLCDRCKVITNKCAICHLPAKGLFLWCQGCSHGGHLQHIKDWFSRNIDCPSGCGHICEYT